MTQDNAQNIRDRAFRFACDASSLALQLNPRPGVRCIVDQLLKSATSVGANLEEAKAGSSRPEFARCVDIALKESREAVYWLRICLALRLSPAAATDRLRDEGEQIARILGAISINTKRRIWAAKTVFAFCILTFALLWS